MILGLKFLPESFWRESAPAVDAGIRFYSPIRMLKGSKFMGLFRVLSCWLQPEQNDIYGVRRINHLRLAALPMARFECAEVIIGTTPLASLGIDEENLKQITGKILVIRSATHAEPPVYRETEYHECILQRSSPATVIDFLQWYEEKFPLA